MITFRKIVCISLHFSGIFSKKEKYLNPICFKFKYVHGTTKKGFDYVCIRYHHILLVNKDHLSNQILPR